MKISLQKILNFISYCGFRLFGSLIAVCSYKCIHRFGRFAGLIVYHLHRSFRKKTMSNLSIAFGKSKTEEERKQIAKESFQNLTITCLEFFRLKKSKGKLEEIVTTCGGEKVLELMGKGQGMIFLTGHQANWEIPFLAISDKYPGIAIGRPINNRWLYDWVLSVREMNGGKIVMPKNAIRMGLRVLKEGQFIGIVGDQAFPESTYSYPLFQTRAWTTSAPALLAYKTGSPIVVGITKRENNHYYISGSPPIWPNQNNPMKEEVVRMMDLAMGYLEKSIEQTPSQWLWQHDRWKQQGVDHVKRKYRYGFIAIIFPREAQEYLELLPLFRAIYPRSFLSFFVPKGISFSLEGCEVYTYEDEKDLFVRDWRYQLVLDFYNSKSLRRHFLRLGAFHALSLKEMQKIAKDRSSLSQTVKKALCKPECLQNVTL